MTINSNETVEKRAEREQREAQEHAARVEQEQRNNEVLVSKQEAMEEACQWYHAITLEMSRMHNTNANGDR